MQHNQIIDRPQFSANIYSRPPATPESVKKATPSPRDKPLPTIPATQINTSPLKPSVTLLDATDKPLRGTSSEQNGEMWPTLKARRVDPTTPLSDKMRDTGDQLLRQSTMGERYPKLGDLTRNLSGELPTSIYARPSLTQTAVPQDDALGVEDPFADSHNAINGVQRNVSDSSHLSAGAAALEKSTSQNFSEVRQTRTSSLRARLSAGEVVKHRDSKIGGFTDFTTNGLSDNQRPIKYRSSLSLRKASNKAAENEANGASEQTSPAIRPYASVGDIGRAPAKFVGGSRRMPPRRPLSRGSLREESRPSTAGTRPNSRETISSSGKDDRSSAKGAKESRRSLIPVPKVVATTHTASAKDGNISDDTLHAPFDTPRPSQRSSIIPFEDSPQPMEATSVTITSVGEKATVTDTMNKKGGLESIVESPRQAYTFRRLSTKSPEFGPTLRISPSARQYIMGDGEKENRPRSSEKLRSKLQPATEQRPQSSDGHPTPRSSLLGSRRRQRKAMSADIDAMLDNDKTTETARPISTQLSTTSRAQSVTDSFFDAPEEIHHEDSTQLKTPIDARDWIAPLKQRPININHGAPNIKDFAYTPTLAASKSEEYDPFNYENTPTQSNNNNGQIPTPALALPAAQEPVERNGAAVVNGFVTPEHAKPEAISPSSFPPRSSSRLEKADSSSNKTLSAHAVTKETGPPTPLRETGPPTTLRERGPPTPPKEFVNRQNNLGSALGHASSQLNLMEMAKENSKPAPKSKRMSTAAGSFRSQSSLATSTSKSRFNIRGLFHKSSTEDTAKKLKSNSHLRSTKSSDSKLATPDDKGKAKPSTRAAVQTNGSPFPAISEIHPIHRPTARPSPRSSAIITSTISTLQGSAARPTTPGNKRSPPPSTSALANGIITPKRSLPHPHSNLPNLNMSPNLLLSTNGATPGDIGAEPALTNLSSQALSLLATARSEASPQKKERLLQVGKVLVDVITQARDAERAVEEARLALGRAEGARDRCLEAVKGLVGLGWGG